MLDPQFLTAVENTIKVCTLLTLFIAIANAIITFVGKAKEPENKQDERISALEERMTQAERKLSNDSTRFDDIESGNKIILQSLLALMEHALDGNSVDKLKDTKDALEKYLIEK